MVLAILLGIIIVGSFIFTGIQLGIQRGLEKNEDRVFEKLESFRSVISKESSLSNLTPIQRRQYSKLMKTSAWISRAEREMSDRLYKVAKDVSKGKDVPESTRYFVWFYIVPIRV